MHTDTFRQYFFNCFLLIIPVLAWNLTLADQLPRHFQPEVFWHDIPPSVAYGEHTSRILIFLLSLLMPLRIQTETQRTGLVLYAAGLLMYCASWIPLIYFPDSAWSHSTHGFMAPAWTPLFWLTGIAIASDGFHFRIPYSRLTFLLVSFVFLVFHNMHTYLIYQRVH